MWANCVGSTGRASTGGCGHESTTSKREVKRRDSSILRLPHPLAVLAVTRREGAPPHGVQGWEGRCRTWRHTTGSCISLWNEPHSAETLLLFKPLTRSIQG